MNKQEVVKIFEDVNVLLKEKFKDKKNRIIAGVVAAVIALGAVAIGVAQRKMIKFILEI